MIFKKYIDKCEKIMVAQVLPYFNILGLSFCLEVPVVGFLKTQQEVLNPLPDPS